MRCRKVRSFLSVYCNDELTGRRQLAVREHLSTCTTCRKEEAFYRSLRRAIQELPRLSVSADFNARLLDRVARERFKETRTKAHLPRRAPVVRWRHVVPATAAVAVLLVAGAFRLWPGHESPSAGLAEADLVADDLYRTVQPINNPNVTASLHKGWSFDRQLQQTDRMTRLSNSITDRSGFSNLHLTGGIDSRTAYGEHWVPYAPDYYRIRPVIRVYQSPGSTDSKEVEKVY